MSGGFIETLAFNFTSSPISLNDILPEDTTGTRVPVTIHVRNASGTPFTGDPIKVYVASDSIYLPTNTAVPANDPVQGVVSSNATCTLLLYPTSALSGHPPYKVFIGGFSDPVGFNVPDAGGDIIVNMVPLTQRGLVGAAPANIAAGTNSSVHHTTPANLQEWMENIQYRLDHP